MSPYEFISGGIFGVALLSAGVWEPGTIKSQMSFRSNTMITVMMSASAVSAIVLDIEHRLKIMPKKHRPPSNLGFFSYDGNVIGGLLLGTGMTITGACPGTSLVQAGAGMANGFLTIIGGVLGAMAFVKLQPAFKSIRDWLIVKEHTDGDSPDRTTVAIEKPLDVAAALGLQPLVVLLIWIPMCLAVMQLVLSQDYSAREIPPSGLLAPAYGGLLIGIAQLVTTLLTGHAIGASAAYQDIANWIDSRLFPNPDDDDKPSFSTSSVVFSEGVMCAAAALSLLVSTNADLGSENVPLLKPRFAAHAIAGGFAMVLGARIAGGCTSGHGISGLARFSLSSLVTTASLFSAGILTAAILR